MSLQIKVNGRYLSPERAASEALPLDSLLVCPRCEHRPCLAKPARTIEQFGRGTAQQRAEMVPRVQDRRCPNCGHIWEAVLMPTAMSERPELFRG